MLASSNSKEKKPKVSIITPTFNHENFIGQCIESVCSQTFHNWEMIIINDGSTDKTKAVIENYTQKDQRLISIDHDFNWGIYRLEDTYNQALNLARGEFIAILEGDDFWPEDKLNIQIDSFNDINVVLSWGKAAFVDEEGTILGNKPAKIFKQDIMNNSPKGKILKKLLYKNFIPPVTVLSRRSILLAIGGFQSNPNLPFVDYSTWLALSLEGEFHFIKDIVGYWRVHEDQSTTHASIEQAISAGKYALDFFPKINLEVQKAYNLSTKTIKQRLKSRVGFALLSRARVKLAKNEKKPGRKFLVMVLRDGSLYTKLIALLGLALSVFNTNFEHFIKRKK